MKRILIFIILILCLTSEVFAGSVINASDFVPRKHFINTSSDNDNYPKGKTIADKNSTLTKWTNSDSKRYFAVVNKNDMVGYHSTQAIYPQRKEFYYGFKEMSDFSATLLNGKNDTNLLKKINKAGNWSMSSDNLYTFNPDDYTWKDGDYPQILYKNLKIYDDNLKKYVRVDLKITARKANKRECAPKWKGLHAIILGRSKGQFKGLPNVRIVGIGTLQINIKAFYHGTYNKSTGKGKVYKFKTSLTYGDIDSYQAVGAHKDNVSGGAAYKNANFHFGIEDSFFVASSNFNDAIGDTEEQRKAKFCFYLDTTRSAADGYAAMTFSSRQSQKSPEGKFYENRSSQENEPNGNWAYFGASTYSQEPPVTTPEIENPKKYVWDSKTDDDIDNNWKRDAVTDKDGDVATYAKSYSHNVLSSRNQTFTYRIIQKIPPYMSTGSKYAKANFKLFQISDELPEGLELVPTNEGTSSENKFGNVLVKSVTQSKYNKDEDDIVDNLLDKDPTKGRGTDVTEFFNISQSGKVLNVKWTGGDGDSDSKAANKNKYLYGKSSDSEPNYGTIIQVTFKVRIKKNITFAQLKSAHNGTTAYVDIPNQASLTYSLRSDEVNHTLKSTASKTSQQSGENWTDKADAGKHVYTRIAMPGTPKVIKVDEDSQRINTPATFVLKDGDGNTVATATTSNGEANFGEVAAGTYYIYETEAPTGYAKQSGSTKIVVTAGETTSVTIKNYRPSIKIKKLDSETGAELSGAQFKIYSGQTASGTALTLTAGGSQKNTFNANEEIKGFSFNESASHNYFTIQEVTTPSGYNNNGTKTFDLAIVSGVQEIKMYNTPKSSTITIQKVDAANNNPLSGANFELRLSSATGTRLDGPKAVGSDGKASFTINANKTYYIVETKAPAGYKGSGPYKITTDADANPTVVNTANNTTISLTSGVYRLPNNAVYGNFTLEKQDSVTHNKLEGATFVLSGTKANGDNITPISKPTTSTGTASFTGVPEGSYKLVETVAPNAHYQNVGSWTVVIDNDGVVKINQTTVSGNYVIENPPTKIVIKKKTRNESLLAGATLKIYSGAFEGQTTPTGDALVTIPSTNTGNYDVTGYLTIGSQYTLVETNAPSGYKKADNVVFTVTNAAKSTEGQGIVMYDDPFTFDIPIRKTNESGSPIGGAEFELRTNVNTANSSTAKIVSNNGTAIWNNLGVGTYYIVETTVPNGYLNGGPLKVECKSDGTMVVTDQRTNTTVSLTDGYYNFKNPEPPKGSITLTKIQTETPSVKLAGAQFVLSGKADNGTDVYLVATYAGGGTETNSTGQFTFSNIPVGTGYTISEIKVPTGYSIGNIYRVNVTYNGSATVTTLTGNTDASYNTNKYVQNDYQETVKHDVDFLKKDDQGNIVQGVKFQLTGPSGFAPREYVSGADGFIHITELDAGVYTLQETYVPAPYTTLKSWTITVGADVNS